MSLENIMYYAYIYIYTLYNLFALLKCVYCLHSNGFVNVENTSQKHEMHFSRHVFRRRRALPDWIPDGYTRNTDVVTFFSFSFLTINIILLFYVQHYTVYKYSLNILTKRLFLKQTKFSTSKCIQFSKRTQLLFRTYLYYIIWCFGIRLIKTYISCGKHNDSYVW